ncbi:MAG TPA: hypothetical protein VIS78_05040, partial [Blastocatellia bacterium]
FLVICVVIYLSSRSRLAMTVFEDIISLWFVVLIVGGSIYKLAQWWRYRHDPAKREQAASLSQVYPSALRRFFYDEKEDEAKRP